MYSKRLAATREMLNSPLPGIVQEAYDLLFQLWIENADNPDFIETFLLIAHQHPKQIFENRLIERLQQLESVPRESVQRIISELQKLDFGDEYKDFREIDSSPMTGIILRKILKGHDEIISHIAWSPDGNYLASPSFDSTIGIWNVENGEHIFLKEHNDAVWSVAWSPNGDRLASCSDDDTFRIWNTQNWKVEFVEKVADAHTVAWSPNAKRLALVYGDRIRILDSGTWKTVIELRGHESQVNSIAWSSDSGKLASVSDDMTLRVWNIESNQEDSKIYPHKDKVVDLTWVPGQPYLLASSGEDNVIKLWDIRSNQPIIELEGHTDLIKSLSFSSDGAMMASKSTDNTIIFWRSDNWDTIGKLYETSSHNIASRIAFHPRLPYLATLGENDKIVRIWELDTDILLQESKSIESIRYTTAKLVLVGDSGVGKTGLGWRLKHEMFKEHASTHGQQFWVIDDLGLAREDGTECEAVLWDLAGQQDYRSVHSIFLDKVDLALLLFDPTNREEPFRGINFWVEQLKARSDFMPPSILVGARQDRGDLVVSKQVIDEFCQKYNISGGYSGTSAKTGEGLDELINNIKSQIQWEQKTATVTTNTFKRVKEYILSLKEKSDNKDILMQPDELFRQLKNTDSDWKITRTEMMTAVSHLENHGYVTILQNSASRKFILLAPELLANLASSIVMQASRHPRELGSSNERELFQGKTFFEELNNLTHNEGHILLDAAISIFLKHNICFRDSTLIPDTTLLIFPNLIKQELPELDNIETEEGASYIIRGQVENTYAALVVLLGYTQTFTRVNQWHNQVRYVYGAELLQVCGFRLISEHDGEIEIVLHYSNAMPVDGRRKFQGLFEKFLFSRNVKVLQYTPVMCPNGHSQERTTVIRRIDEGKMFLFCEECGEKISLADAIKPLSLSSQDADWIYREEALASLRSIYETHLVSVKSGRHELPKPRCYISYLKEQKSWASQLEHDLISAGVDILKYHNEIQVNDFIILVGTPAYKLAPNFAVEPVAMDINFVHRRVSEIPNQIINMIPVLRVGDLKEAFPDNLLSTQDVIDFRDETQYIISLFDLILTIYDIPFKDPTLGLLRSELHEKWRNDLSKITPKKENIETMEPPIPKIFISYSHKDEKYKDELVKMLVPLQDQGILKIWQDREIVGGDEWYQAIQDAMNTCDLALLLISGDFLASRFIRNEELSRLLQRRKEEGLRVVPIIIRSCKWQSVPVLKDLQALPKDGKPVVSFEGVGKRDWIWTEIATSIENLF